MRDKIFSIYKKLFSNEDVILRIKKSSLSSFILGFIFAAPIFIGASWLIGAGQAQTIDTTDEFVAEESGTVAEPVELSVREDDYILGNKDAEVTLMVFSDLECSFCSRHHGTINSLVEEYGDSIRVVWRHFPLSFHQYAADAALAAECAGEQGKFWQYLDEAFANQANFGDDLWVELAGDLDLNISKFSQCFNDNNYESKIMADVQTGADSGVQGTPATFVNGELVSGAQPIEVFEGVIDTLLE